MLRNLLRLFDEVKMFIEKRRDFYESRRHLPETMLNYFYDIQPFSNKTMARSRRPL